MWAAEHASPLRQNRIVTRIVCALCLSHFHAILQRKSRIGKHPLTTCLKLVDQQTDTQSERPNRSVEHTTDRDRQKGGRQTTKDTARAQKEPCASTHFSGSTSPCFFFFHVYLHSKRFRFRNEEEAFSLQLRCVVRQAYRHDQTVRK